MAVGCTAYGPVCVLGKLLLATQYASLVLCFRVRGFCSLRLMLLGAFVHVCLSWPGWALVLPDNCVNC